MKVSVLSAVHNEEAFIEEMIQSVLAQSHQDWELIFVSDGSTDRTAEIIAEYAAADGRIRLSGDGARRGKAAAFNSAFAQSLGGLIVLLAGDDTLPQHSLKTRVNAMADLSPWKEDVVAFFKLRTMSTDPSRNGIVLPRGNSASHSGGTITLTHHLASRVFPIDESLPSEDLWLTRAAEGVATEVREYPDVVLNYRVHQGNSNPRDRDFATMSTAMGERHRAWKALLEANHLQLSEKTRRGLEGNARLEQLRLKRDILGMARCREAPILDRAAYISMSSPLIFAVRKRFFRLLSGRRGR